MPTQQESATGEYLTGTGVMTKLKISRRTLERYIKDGKLTAVFLPSGHRRFLDSDVDALLTTNNPAESNLPISALAGSGAA